MVIKIFPKRKELIGFIDECHRMFEGELTLTLHKVFQNSSQLILRPVTFERTKVLQENKTTGSLRNVNSKLLNKICANQIQPDIQRIMYHNQLISSTRMLWHTRLNHAIYCIYRMKDKIQNPPNRFRKKVFGKKTNSLLC